MISSNKGLMREGPRLIIKSNLLESAWFLLRKLQLKGLKAIIKESSKIRTMKSNENAC